MLKMCKISPFFLPLCKMPCGLASGDFTTGNSSGTLLEELSASQEASSASTCIFCSFFDPDEIALVWNDRPSPNAAIFITLIVKAPVIQILTMLSGFFMIALEFPVPQLKGFAIHRSIVLRIVLLLMQAFISVLFYQVNSCGLLFPSNAAYDVVHPHTGYKCRLMVNNSSHVLHSGADASRDNGGSQRS